MIYKLELNIVSLLTTNIVVKIIIIHMLKHIIIHKWNNQDT
jgi:hypothetical protein